MVVMWSWNYWISVLMDLRATYVSAYGGMCVALPPGPLAYMVCDCEYFKCVDWARDLQCKYVLKCVSPH